MKKSFFFLSKNSTEVKNVIYKIQPVLRRKTTISSPQKINGIRVNQISHALFKKWEVYPLSPSRRAPIINYEQCPTSSRPERTAALQNIVSKLFKILNSSSFCTVYGSHCLQIKQAFSNFRALFQGENDFMVCLKESFPHLKTRRLTRVEWCKV